jgi:hypothetical protein
MKSERGSIMSTRIDNFTKQLHDNLEAVEDRAKSLQESIQSATKKTQAEIQSKLYEAKTKLDAKKQEFDEYRADRAEDYAATAIFLAMATMEEAEKATLEAIAARLDAEFAAGTTEK